MDLFIYFNLVGCLEDGLPVDGDKWLITMVSYKSPNWGCGTPSKWLKWLTNGGDPITTYIQWEPILQVEVF